MTFAYPFALLLLLPAFGLLAWLKLWHGRAGLGLPGHWHRIIDTTMQSFMVKQVVSQRQLPVGLWLVIWALLVLALARPVLDVGEPAPSGNLVGRVIALDVGASVDPERQRWIAYRILDAAPTTPTALVVATGEAFDIVPFTTDRGHLDRYLQVIKPEVMPVSGRSPGMAVTHAESLLARAGMVVGQLVLVTGGTVPAAEAAAAGDWLRAVVVDGDRASAWEDYAERIGAQLADTTTIDDVISELDGKVADTLQDSDDAAGFAAGPWLIAAAACLWLLFFRRIRSA